MVRLGPCDRHLPAGRRGVLTLHNNRFTFTLLSKVWFYTRVKVFDEYEFLVCVNTLPTHILSCIRNFVELSFKESISFGLPEISPSCTLVNTTIVSTTYESDYPLQIVSIESFPVLRREFHKYG